MGRQRQAGDVEWHQAGGSFAISAGSLGLQGLRVLTGTPHSHVVSLVYYDFSSETQALRPLTSHGHLLAILMELAA